MKKETRGRKPVSDKKKPITIYVQESYINKIGVDKLKQQLINIVKKTD